MTPKLILKLLSKLFQNDIQNAIQNDVQNDVQNVPQNDFKIRGGERWSKEMVKRGGFVYKSLHNGSFSRPSLLTISPPLFWNPLWLYCEIHLDLMLDSILEHNLDTILVDIIISKILMHALTFWVLWKAALGCSLFFVGPQGAG